MLVSDLEALLANPTDMTLKAELVKRLAKLDAGQAKGIAKSRTRGDPNRVRIDQAAKACIAKGLELTTQNLMDNWPDVPEGEEPATDATVKRRYNEWLVHGPA